MATTATPYLPMTKAERFDHDIDEVKRKLATMMLQERGIRVIGERVERLAEADNAEVNRLLKQYADEDRTGYEATRGGSFLGGSAARDSEYATLRESVSGLLSGERAVADSLDRLRQAQKDKQADDLVRGIAKSILQNNQVSPTRERIDALLAATGDDEVEDLILQWQAGDDARKPNPKPKDIEESEHSDVSYRQLREEKSALFSRR